MCSWMNAIFITMTKKKDNLDTKFSLISVLFLYHTHFAWISLNEWVRISSGNPQSFTKKKMLNFLLGERVSGCWDGKQRELQLKRQYSVQYGILSEKNLKYISKIWISHWLGSIFGFWQYLANPGQDRGKSFHLSVMDYLDIETQVILLTNCVFLSWR